MHREMIVRDYMFMSASDLMSTINCMSADWENCIGKRAKLRHLIQPTRWLLQRNGNTSLGPGACLLYIDVTSVNRGTALS